MFKRRCKKKQKPEKSMIGKIVDMSLEDFKEELVKQKVNVGTMNNLILNLEGIYYELRMRKDGVIKLVTDGKKTKDDPEIQSALNGLYAEMTKVEQKITYLKEHTKELMNVDLNT